MNTHFRDLMSRATALTRSGDLTGATDILRDALQTGAASVPVQPAAAAAVRPERAAPAPTVQREHDAGTFTAGAYACAAGGRDYKLYVPPQAGQRALPLVVMLHGCTQDPDDFAAGTGMNDAARDDAFFVLYPAQAQNMNPQRCWNWFKHSHQQRGRGEPDIIAGMTRKVMAEHRIDPRRVYVAGLSAGGAMAAILGDTYPDLYAAVGVHSGLAAGAASDLPSALASMQSGASAAAAGKGLAVPAIVFHGDADSTVHPRNGEQVAAASAGAARCHTVVMPAVAGQRQVTLHVYRSADDRVLAEHWQVHGAPHAWSGGSPRGSYTDPRGPAATAEMLRFFLEHPRAGAAH